MQPGMRGKRLPRPRSPTQRCSRGLPGQALPGRPEVLGGGLQRGQGAASAVQQLHLLPPALLIQPREGLALPGSLLHKDGCPRLQLLQGRFILLVTPVISQAVSCCPREQLWQEAQEDLKHLVQSRVDQELFSAPAKSRPKTFKELLPGSQPAWLRHRIVCMPPRDGRSPAVHGEASWPARAEHQGAKTAFHLQRCG